jgi:hypothetical protein
MQTPSPSHPGDENAFEAATLADLQVRVDDFLAQKQACAARIKELLFSENRAAGIVHAQEIFSLQQDKLRLQVEADCCRNKINRIRLFGLEAELQATPPTPPSSST